MSILLKNILKEIDTNSVDQHIPLNVQCYIDMDGVLVDMNKGFQAISGGKLPEEVSRKEFWKLIGSTPKFWLNLPETPDGRVLWNFVSENFEHPAPVILSAGQGATILTEKTAWIRKHISETAKVVISPSGIKKPDYVIERPNTVHILIDDTQKNVDAWNNTEKHRIAILHKNTADTIKQLKNYIIDGA